MTWLAELIVEEFWEGVVYAAYRRWGYVAAAIALFGPFVFFGLLIWWVVG